jgi:hypothetical protein
MLAKATEMKVEMVNNNIFSLIISCLAKKERKKIKKGNCHTNTFILHLKTRKTTPYACFAACSAINFSYSLCLSYKTHLILAIDF